MDDGEGAGQANGRTEPLRNILAAKALARMGVSGGGGAAAAAAARNPEEVYFLLGSREVYEQ